MKQFLGFLLIIGCIPLLIFLTTEVKTELTAANKQEKQIEAAVVLPQVETTYPLRMVDNAGNLFNEEYVEWKQPLSLKKIPKTIQQLFIFSEDEDFYEHKGFDVSAIARAFIVNTSEQGIQQGASTITQQLVRMRYLTDEKTYERKLTELFFAYELEQTYSKDEILEMYLNEMYFSNQVYGIGGAATYYFSKPLEELSVAEMAFLAAIPNNPSLYDPLKHFDNTKKRQERLLETLATQGVLSDEELAQTIATPINLSIKHKVQQSPAYSTYVIQELRWLVAKSEGLDVEIADASTDDEKEALKLELDGLVDALMQNGITIYTALNAEKQNSDEQAITNILGNGELQASAVTVDNATREIVSLYAGKNYEKLNLHRSYQAPRQPGSSFKPIAVYAPYIESTGANENSIVSGGSYCVESFCPQNYGGAIYGNVSLSTAFKYSLNTSALRLMYRNGLDKTFEYLNKFQFRSIGNTDRTYSVALGGLTYGVTTLEMADAYSSFIDGYYKPVHSIRKVTNANGETLYSWNDEQQMIWSTKTVKTMRSLLHAVVQSGTGVGLYSRGSSYLGAKTGTTNDYKDFWLAGLNDQYTTAVWLGYDKPRSMESLERAQIHFKIFNKIMN